MKKKILTGIFGLIILMCCLMFVYFCAVQLTHPWAVQCNDGGSYGYDYCIVIEELNIHISFYEVMYYHGIYSIDPPLYTRGERVKVFGFTIEDNKYLSKNQW